MNDDQYIELRCAGCGNRLLVGVAQMVEHLRHVGVFKRQKDPAPQLVRELYTQQIPLLACSVCGQVGYDQHSPDEFDDEQWGQDRKCEVCKQVIPAERLEVFPDSRRCTACQQSADQGEDTAEIEYCPRCGGIMELRLRGGAGITGYAMRCSSCRYTL